MIMLRHRLLTQAERNWFLGAMQDNAVKAEIAKHVRMQIDQMASQHDGQRPMSYDALVSGDVNMQNRLMASGYDVYGKTIITGNKPLYGNENIYMKLKNKIRYRQGNAPDDGYRLRGRRGVF